MHCSDEWMTSSYSKDVFRKIRNFWVNEKILGAYIELLVRINAAHHSEIMIKENNKTMSAHNKKKVAILIVDSCIVSDIDMKTAVVWCTSTSVAL